MADVFNEADQQFRAAQTRDLVARGWPYAAAVAVALVLAALGFWIWSAYADAQAAKASNFYAQGLAAAQKGDAAAARHAFDQIGGAAPASYKTLALMQQAGLSLKAGAPAAALNLLDAASHAAPDRILGDAAALEAAFVAMDSQPLSSVENRLQPLMAAHRPYRDMAREADATAKLVAGRTGEAKRDFQLLILSQDVSDAARQRAEAAIAMIDSGAAASVPAAVKAELALPPLPPAPAGSAAAAPGAQ